MKHPLGMKRAYGTLPNASLHFSWQTCLPLHIGKADASLFSHVFIS
jgi:hypothetical protein